MKLIRYGQAGKEKTGVIVDDVMYDTSAFGGDYNEQFFEDNGLERLAEFVKANQGRLIEIEAGERLGSPIARPSKIVCIGLNYADHAKETNAPIPAEPVIFMKSTTSLAGPYDNIIIPKNSVKTDWEVELAVVIGKKASYVDETDAADYIAGYLLHNDVSEREFQLERGGTWDKGKGCDTFAPMGPFMATPDEIGDVDNIKLWLKVNGETMQNGTTANFVFKIPHLIAYVSRFMTLLPGDVISTGTPAGVGLGFKPPVYLKPGDVVELGADGLGVSKQTLIAYDKIDAHQHFWIFDPVRDSWINDEMKAIQRDFLPAGLEYTLKQNGIQGCVAVQADQSEDQNAFLLGLTEGNDFIKGIVGWVDLQAENIEERLEHYSHTKLMKGFRHLLQGETNRALMLEPKFKRGFSVLEKYGFTYDILIFPDQLKYANTLAREFPTQKFVLDHIAKPDIKNGKIAGWQEEIAQLAANENVYCKISGMVTEADWHNWNNNTFTQYLDVIFNSFGTSRVMFGSDWPVCLVAATDYAQMKAVVDTYTQHFRPDEQEKIFGGNAVEFYGL